MYEYCVIIDIETTGFSSEKDNVIEVACLLANMNNNPSSLTVIDSMDSVVDLSDRVTIPSTITKLTGIDDETMFLIGVEPATVYSELNSMLTKGSTLFISYSVHFCGRFIEEAFRQNNMVMPKVDFLDLMTVAKDRKPYPHKFVDVCEHYGIEREQAACTALEDAHSMVDLFNVMAHDTDNLLEYVNKIGYIEKYGVDGQRLDGVIYAPQSISPFKEHGFIIANSGR